MDKYRDDSYGDYGQWINPQDQSWLDYLKMKGSDVGGGAYNALANITGALSPVGTSPEGNMALQVPPMVNALMGSGKTIADRGGWGFSGVEEIDAPLKKAWADILWAGHGGNALAGLTKPRGALGAGAMREQPKGITAYHGSPHDFDKFSLDAIGTGEGAQAYGHGLYFADSEGVARSYRDALRSPSTLSDGSPLNPSNYEITQIIGKHQNDLPKLAEELTKYAENGKGNPYSGANEAAAIVEQIRSGNFKPGPPGRMYQVRINADPESFLDWDKPLSQQSEAIQNLYNQRVAPGLKTREIGENPNLGMLYDVLHPEGGSIGVFPKEKLNDVLAAPSRYVPTRGEDIARGQEQMLREAGIPGIRYLDGNSRGSGSGSSNYVVFDDSLIEILKKYGIAAGAVGAGALAQPDQASAQGLPDWLKF